MSVSLMRQGVPILAGSDCGNPFTVPGFDLHEELKLLVDAGLSTIEVLKTAILNPARFLGREKDFGTVEKGKMADLLLLDGNPLDEIRNTNKIAAVFVDGELFDRKRLDRMLTAAKAGPATNGLASCVTDG